MASMLCLGGEGVKRRAAALLKRGGVRLCTPADWAALLVSAVASPFVVLPVFAVAITARYSPDVAHFLRWSGIAVFFSTVVPLSYVLAGVRRGRLSDVHVMYREQRGGPFAVALVSSAVGTAVLKAVGAPAPLVAVGAAMVCNGVVFAAITTRWKVSLHLSVFAGCVACAAVLVDARFWALALFVPAILWARVRRTRHSPAQGAVAIAVAVAVTLAVLAGLNRS
ncbi:MAG: hypothetical protein QHJ73_00940 [Armatimonadota bacterium]|nr:hypothetical protein [Armatimonadota bacterium]